MTFSQNPESAKSDFIWYALTILVFTTFVSIAGYVLIQQQKQFLLKDKQNEIATIADLKTAQLVQWRKERFAEAASIRANAMMAQCIYEYVNGSTKDGIQQKFKGWLANLIDLGEYSRGILFQPDGKIVVSDADLKIPPSEHYLALVSEAAQEHELILSDFHSDGNNSPYNINLVIPIMHSVNGKLGCIAVLILDIDPTKQLYPLIRSWPTTSPTAETLLVMQTKDSVLFLNDLRHKENRQIHLTAPLSNSKMPAVRAALGEEGNFEGIDYRNIKVLCTTRVIPGTKLGIVAKIDVKEVLSPLFNSILYIVLTGLFVVITMTLGVFLWGLRRKSENLRKLVELQKKSEIELQNIHANLEQQILLRTHDLSEINTLLRQEIIERQQLEQQLLNAKRLEAIGQIAGGVAHEVRNPLNAILTITEALFREDEIAANPELEPYILHIRTQVNRLVQLMNDLLDLGRTIPVTNLQPTHLYDICRETLELWKSVGISKNKRGLLTSSTDDISIMVLSDSLRLQQVFFNLLENAGHYTPENGKITICVSPENHYHSKNMAIVHIIDQGSGIPQDRLPHIFEPFYTDRKGGTGLGLALVRHFIESMGGSVRIWNNINTPGCTAEVCIPIYRKELQ